MGLLQKLAGNAQQINVSDVQKEMSTLLVDGETIEIAFQIIRDRIIFTNLRLITIDKQGVTGRKVDYRSIPYDKIVQFSKESSGILDLDAELKIWVASMAEPLKFEFSKDAPINDVYALLSGKILTRK